MRSRFWRRVGWTLIYLAGPLGLIGVGYLVYWLGGLPAMLFAIGLVMGWVAWELAGIRTEKSEVQSPASKVQSPEAEGRRSFLERRYR